MALVDEIRRNCPIRRAGHSGRGHDCGRRSVARTIDSAVDSGLVVSPSVGPTTMDTHIKGTRRARAGACPWGANAGRHGYTRTSFALGGTGWMIAALAALVLTMELVTTASAETTGIDSLPALHTLAADDVHPSAEFSRHQRIRPVLQHGRHRREIAHTQQADGSHAEDLTLRFEHDGGEMIIDLRLNDDLLPAGNFLRYQAPDGSPVIVNNFTRSTADHCHYMGSIRGRPKSRAAISTCHGVTGMIFDGLDTYHIGTPRSSTTAADEHFLYNHSDLIATAHKCGHDTTSDHSDVDEFSQHLNRITRSKRSTDTDTIRGPYNSNKHSSYVELVLVIDNSVYRQFKSPSRVNDYCKSLVNIVNALYVPLNIFVALTGVVVWSEKDEFEISSEGENTLHQFAIYRRDHLLRDHPNDNAHLLTRKKFADGVVGKAYKSEMCTYATSVGIATDHSTNVGVVATTIAHEMGHNFGMEHDEEKCKCDVERCIMAASSSSNVTVHWSSCSIDQLNRAFHHGFNYCLKNKPTSLFNSPTCGNGFVEPGEQCDCGLAQFCSNPCCDPTSCMLRSNASCATGSCCDLNTCHPRIAGSMCRSADDECDLPEFCTGESEYCPPDYFRQDTAECDDGRAYCYHGQCRSHDDQCRTLWGPSGRSTPDCYAKNTNGSRHGSCGYDKKTKEYKRCPREDIMCGILQCRHLNERLEFGMESRALLSYSFITVNNVLHPCRTVNVDFGLDSVDPGLTPNGAKCGENKMCVDQRCLSVESLRGSGVGLECANNCSGHGLCDNTGQCHCEVGFAPPLCDEPGPGGSLHSGPATNPSDGTGIVRIMYVFFLGVVPFISLSLFFVYYWRQNRPLFLRKSANVFKSVKSSPPHRPRNPPSSHPGAIVTPTSNSGITSTPSSTDDMNSALLRATPATPDASNEPTALNNNMFGHFKGFSLKPLPQNSRPANLGATNVAFVHPVAKTEPSTIVTDSAYVVPNRSAPPIPAAAAAKFEAAPALPPFNPGSTARPLISSPILEASTCSAKELVSPLRHNAEKLPVRAAPAPPSVLHIPTPVIHGIKAPAQARPDPPHIKEKKAKESTLRRFASFLIKDDRKADDARPKASIDKDKMKNIQISSPISNTDLTVLPTPSAPELIVADRTSINRTQSMREPSTDVTITKRANLPAFGSMRHPGGTLKRPGSVVGSSRPKSPPPPRPPALPITTMPVPQFVTAPKQLVPSHQNEYDDCEAVEPKDTSPTPSDNIYSVIDEYQKPVKSSPVKKPVDTQKSASVSSMGLLGEIVNELGNRNLDSIYSVSTLSKKKDKDAKGVGDRKSTYVNSAELADQTDSEYSNLKSGTPSAATGYIRPSVAKAPIARVAPVHKNTPSETPPPTPIGINMSSFKRKDTDATPVVPDEKKVSLPSKVGSTSKPPSNVPTNTTAPAAFKSTTTTPFSRTKTPPSLEAMKTRTRSPSPSGGRAKPTTTTKPVMKSMPPKASTTDSTKKPTPKPETATINKPKPATTKPDVSLTKQSSFGGSSVGYKRPTPSSHSSFSSKPSDKWQSTTSSFSATPKTAVDPKAQSFSSTGTSNKFGARAGSGGKSSAVASLQQKFEGPRNGAKSAGSTNK